MVSHSNGSELAKNVGTAGQVHPSSSIKDPSNNLSQQIVHQSTMVKGVDFVIRRHGMSFPRFRASRNYRNSPSTASLKMLEGSLPYSNTTVCANVVKRI